MLLYRSLGPLASSVPYLIQRDDIENGAEPDAARRLLERLLRNRHQFGVTRVACLSGLDRLRLPIVQAFTPLAKSNASSQGKGLSCAQAAISALMEALEIWA